MVIIIYSYQGRLEETTLTREGERGEVKEKELINSETEYTQEKIIKKTNNQGRGII